MSGMEGVGSPEEVTGYNWCMYVCLVLLHGIDTQCRTILNSSDQIASSHLTSVSVKLCTYIRMYVLIYVGEVYGRDSDFFPE